MTPEITPEQRTALEQSDDHCLRLCDTQTNKVYVLIEQPASPAIEQEHLEYMRQGVELARQEMQDGKVGPWDIEEAIALGKQRQAKRTGLQEP